MENSDWSPCGANLAMRTLKLKSIVFVVVVIVVVIWLFFFFFFSEIPQNLYFLGLFCRVLLSLSAFIK